LLSTQEKRVEENFLNAAYCQLILSLAPISVEEVFLDALVRATNHCRSGESPDHPSQYMPIEAIHVKSTIIVMDTFSNVNYTLLTGPFPYR